MAPRDLEELRYLYWRDEVVEVILWLRGEGLDERVDARILQRFLGVDAARADARLRTLTANGILLALPGGRYLLTQRGEEVGARLVAGRTADVPEPRRGPCGPECWCHVCESDCETASVL